MQKLNEVFLKRNIKLTAVSVIMLITAGCAGTDVKVQDTSLMASPTPTAVKNTSTTTPVVMKAGAAHGTSTTLKDCTRRMPPTVANLVGTCSTKMNLQAKTSLTAAEKTSLMSMQQMETANKANWR